MTDDDMMKRKIDWINSKWVGEKKCPICQNIAWNFNKDSAALSITKGLDIQLGTFYPLTVVNCKVCGYTIFFNEVIMGFKPSMITGQTKEDSK